MVAADEAGTLHQPRRPAELAASHYQNFLVQTALVNVFDQRGQALIHERRPVAHGVAQVPARLGIDVIVPTEIAIGERRRERVDGDDAGARLGEPAGQQEALAPEMPSIAVANPRIFLTDVEGVGDARVGQHLHGQIAELVRAIQ